MFTDAIIEILEKTEGNEIVRNLLLENLYTNPPNDINNEIRGALHKFLEKNKKFSYKCGHELCKEKSCYSHEISENIFLKYLADKKSNVYILKSDFKRNALNYSFNLIHKRNASNFPGYCSLHDRLLFTDIETQFTGVNMHFINRQCLRIIRRELFKLESDIKLLNELIDNLEIINSEDAEFFLNNIKTKLSIYEKLKLRAVFIYDAVNNGLIHKNYFIDYKEFDVRETGYCFSAMIDFTTDEDDEFVILFFIKLEYRDNSKYIICHIKNRISFESSTNMYPENLDKKMSLIEIMCSRRERLVFSRKFKENLDEITYKILTSNDELFNISSLELFFLSKIFF